MCALSVYLIVRISSAVRDNNRLNINGPFSLRMARALLKSRNGEHSCGWRRRGGKTGQSLQPWEHEWRGHVADSHMLMGAVDSGLAALKEEVFWKSVSHRHSHTGVWCMQDLDFSKCTDVSRMLKCQACFKKKYILCYYWWRKHRFRTASIVIQWEAQSQCRHGDRVQEQSAQFTGQGGRKTVDRNWYEKYFCGKYVLLVLSTHFSSSENTKYEGPFDC